AVWGSLTHSDSFSAQASSLWRVDIPSILCPNGGMPKRKKSSRPKAPAVCPVCGEDVYRGALACPECGADHNSGWRDDAYVNDGLDLPDDEFDYDEFTRREFGGSAKPAGMKTVWWIAGVLLLIVMIVSIVSALTRG